jgi:tRNA threonylcarbamoyladenosine biosynthesis protein TsaE
VIDMVGNISEMAVLNLKSDNPGQTQLLGRHLGKVVLKGDLILLEGELGTGKTCLVQGIAHELGIKQYVFSPSFVLIREYYGRLPLYHIDLYRLDNASEIEELGLEEYLSSDGICVIEWAEKGLPVLPQDYLLIKIKYVLSSETQRTISIYPRGNHYLELTQKLQLILCGEQAWN